ncbi:MAG: hypothetical protein RLZZ69_2978, partial [Cyanobacteriota bacterium]
DAILRRIQLHDVQRRRLAGCDDFHEFRCVKMTRASAAGDGGQHSVKAGRRIRCGERQVRGRRTGDAVAKQGSFVFKHLELPAGSLVRVYVVHKSETVRGDQSESAGEKRNCR